MKDNLLYADEVYAIQGAVFAVYKEMGNAWPEEVYHQCLEKELTLRGIPFDTKKALRIYYKGEPIEKTYIPDFVCYDKIILELKTVEQLNNEHKGQLLNYLRITGMNLGLLINFRAYPKVEILRMAK
jgi:GxxExxY protein